MAYTLTTITTKPTATAWYQDSGGTAAADAVAYAAWVRTTTGFKTTYSERVGAVRPSTHIATKKVIVFDTLADYNAFVAARETQAYYIASQAYNTTNGIVSVDRQSRG